MSLVIMPEETKQPSGQSKKAAVAQSAITAIGTLCGALAGAVAKDGGSIFAVAVGGVVGIVVVSVAFIVTQTLIDRKT